MGAVGGCVSHCYFYSSSSRDRYLTVSLLRSLKVDSAGSWLATTTAA